MLCGAGGFPLASPLGVGMQIYGAVPQEPFAGELPQGVTCAGFPTSVGVLTAAFIDEAVAGIVPEAESALEVH